MNNIEMQTYIGTKVVKARPMTRGEYNKYRGWEMPSNEDGAEEGCLVEYTNGGLPNDDRHAGYISWSPKDVFEDAYRLTQGLTFGEAIEALKRGQRITRAGWNGKGMYLWLLPETVVPTDWIKEMHLKEIAEASESKEVHCLPSIRMKTANGSVLTGWLASQTDMLSEDWIVVS